jgi:Phosphotransferase enzyme family
VSSGRWASIPPASSRWLLPTGPRQAAMSSVRIYHPVTVKGLLGWEAARAMAAAGGFRFLPGSTFPPAEVTQLLADHGIAYRSLALARANHPSRFLALLLGESWRGAGVAKMAFDDKGRAALDTEARALELAARFLTGPVRAPGLQQAADGLLVLEPIEWLPRMWSWRLPAEVAHAVGTYSRLATQGEPAAGMSAHGDFAPWNLLRTKDGWVLLDWEHASSRPPFFDLWHYLLQAHSLLGRPSSRALVRGLRGARGWVRTALVEYSRGLGKPPAEAVDWFDDYITASAEQLGGNSHQERHGLTARARMQTKIADLRG